MSVLIKGKMPEKCFQCVAYDIGSTSCLLFSNGIPARYRLSAREKPDWCELVELPPHGRLIDADALIKLLDNCMFPSDMVTTRAVSMARNWLKESPTILDAEVVEE